MALSPALQKLVSNAANKYSRSTGNRIKPKDGVNRYRFLAPSNSEAPWVREDGQFWADLGVHWIKAEIEAKKPLAVVGCDHIVNQTPCAVCTAIEAAIGSALDEDSKKLYESWRAKLSILVNVLDRSKGSTTGDEVQILELTPTTWGKVMGIIQEYAGEGQNVLDTKEGLDISITKTGKGLNTEYSVNVAAGTSKPVPAAVMKSTQDLFAHVQKEFFRGEETKAIAAIASVSGVAAPRLAAPASRSTPTRALTSAAAEVDDATEEEVVAEIEEEVAPPKPATKPVAAKPAVKPAAKPAPVEDEDDVSADMDDILADLDGI